MGIGEAGREIEALFPAQITQASKGMGSFINIYFHNSDKNSGHIWIYLCDWRLIESSTEVEISDSIDNNANIHDFFPERCC